MKLQVKAWAPAAEEGLRQHKQVVLCPHIQQTLIETLCWSQDPN